jgi:hypothetical protein
MNRLRTVTANAELLRGFFLEPSMTKQCIDLLLIERLDRVDGRTCA